MSVKNYIWDFDGTLYDSYPHITAAFCDTLRIFGIEHSRDEVFDDLSISIAYAAEKYSLTENQMADFRTKLNDYSFEPEIVPFEGLRAVLEAVKNTGGRSFIYTHRRRESLEYYLKKYGFFDYFEESVTSDNGFPDKPSPDGVSYLVEKYGLDPKETVMIGDREIDILSGLGAGTGAWRIEGKFTGAETGASVSVRTAADLLPYIEGGSAAV